MSRLLAISLIIGLAALGDARNAVGQFDPTLSQGINNVLRNTPGGAINEGSRLTLFSLQSPTVQYYFYNPTNRDGTPAAAPATPEAALSPGDVTLNTGYAGRAAVYGDNVRLGTFAGGTFLPSAIPVQGQPYYGSGERANVQGNGSTLAITGQLTTDTTPVQVQAKIATTTPNADPSAAMMPGSGSMIAVQQVYGQSEKVLIGITETAFANLDNSALPETLDLAGPNGRVTVFTNGITGGQGRFSYNLFGNNGRAPGFSGLFSVEQATPEITVAAAAASKTTYGGRSAFPDLLSAWRFSDGIYVGSNYYEQRNLQLSTICRSLGVESSDGSLKQTAFGWGLSLSGGIHFDVNPNLSVRDAFYFSTTYGQGLGHYIVDLHSPAAGVGYDAVFNTNGKLTALPVLACYAGYTHNWTNKLRSTLSVSRVVLTSENSPNQTVATPTYSPYHTGEVASINLLYHKQFNLIAAKATHTFYTGVEYSYAERETLNGLEGGAQRIMWATTISN